MLMSMQGHQVQATSLHRHLTHNVSLHAGTARLSTCICSKQNPGQTLFLNKLQSSAPTWV